MLTDDHKYNMLLKMSRIFSLDVDEVINIKLDAGARYAARFSNDKELYNILMNSPFYWNWYMHQAYNRDVVLNSRIKEFHIKGRAVIGIAVDFYTKIPKYDFYTKKEDLRNAYEFYQSEERQRFYPNKELIELSVNHFHTTNNINQL